MPRAVEVVRKVAPKAKPSYLAAFENGDALLRAHGIVAPDGWRIFWRRSCTKAEGSSSSGRT